MGGGGSKAKAAPAPIPQAPTRWLYDRTGEAVQLQEYGRYVRNGQGGFQLITDNMAPGAGLYTSPEAAREKNPQVWLYDSEGKATKQIFKGGEGPDDVFDESVYNLGPDATPYRHWYDQYGVSQKYAPVSTEMGEGYWESPNKAPRSPTFQAPTPYNAVDPNANIQPDGNTGSQDLAAQKAQSKKRRTGQSKQLTLLGDNSALGASGDNKSLLGA